MRRQIQSSRRLCSAQTLKHAENNAFATVMATRNDTTSDCRTALTDRYCWGVWFACVCYTALVVVILGTFSPEVPGSDNFILSGVHWAEQRLRRGERLRFPVQYVVISQTSTAGCSSSRKCSQLMHTLLNDSDIGYSFVVAGDGNVYEGRSWDSVGSKTGHLVDCSLSIGLLGNFQEVEPGYLQLQALQQLMKLGLNHNKIVKDYKIVNLDSNPPKNLMNALEQLYNYSEMPSEKLWC
ncbi:hypothetical protein L9F63_008766 [Diploptera punctata]|uniref:Peptidoglycan recognition protein family domain-containing protein n=1 Tax=Diploptera punctata TaxID=6984 RepID=A0AAD7Z550_DIPPU|nr:hypothetical protein L9F63_008766 [Diploptera punctata]